MQKTPKNGRYYKCSAAEAQEVRRKNNKDAEGTQHMLAVWMHRGYISLDIETKMYQKTDKYKLKQ